MGRDQKKQESKHNGEYYITVAPGLVTPGHIKNMGMAIWLYLWLLQRLTDAKEGTVLHGKALKCTEIATQLGCTWRSVQRWLHDLRTGGYIRVSGTNNGVRIWILKPKKAFGIEIKPGHYDKSVIPEGSTMPDLTGHNDRFVISGMTKMSHPICDSVVDSLSDSVNNMARESSASPDSRGGGEVSGSGDKKEETKTALKRGWLADFFRVVDAAELPEKFTPATNACDALTLFARCYTGKYREHPSIIKGKHLAWAVEWCETYGELLPAKIKAYFTTHRIQWGERDPRLTLELFKIEIGKIELGHHFDPRKPLSCSDDSAHGGVDPTLPFYKDVEDQEEETEEEAELEDESEGQSEKEPAQEQPQAVAETVTRRIWGTDYEVRSGVSDDDVKGKICERLIPQLSNIYQEITKKFLFNPRIHFDPNTFKKNLARVFDTGISQNALIDEWKKYLKEGGGNQPMKFFEFLSEAQQPAAIGAEPEKGG